ncbi:hypothetical protein DOY81_002971 [Sarcophaga bullata]|nr:hypothetical protein DOY81_002971 [Sarcophaga bullata]
MPGKVGVKIKAGRNLPVMDKSSDTTDAYVEIKLGNVTHKTDVCRKSLNPQWNTDWFRFEVDDAELQDEPLQIRLMDHDTYSANDAIGKVNISLNPLCLETSGQATHGKGTVLSGWIPVFDTMHGIRGEVNVIVKVDLFSDVNKFRQSSCGIPFFHSPCIPIGYRAQVIHGFVEELVVNDDPEYQWIDKIRTPRASNEARQVVFLKLSGQVQRKMGLKAINMGANAVIGYTQCFDLEGDVGVVARGIGTAVTLIKDNTNQPVSADNALIEERTLKYLEFLTGASVNPCKKSSSTLSFSKLNFEQSTVDIRGADSDPESQLMTDLIRQEEGRGGRRIKKFTHKMKHLTNSSRNIFNDKYALLMRKIDEHSRTSSSGSRSLSSVLNFPNKNLNMRSESNSMLDVRKRKTVAHGEPLKNSKTLQRTIHPIIRSVSDDSAMKQQSSVYNELIKQNSSKPQKIGSQTSLSTQSSPDVCSTEQCSFNFDNNINTCSCLEMYSVVNNLDNTKTCIVESLKEHFSNEPTKQKTAENNSDILGNSVQCNINNRSRFSSQPNLMNLNKANYATSSQMHSQSLTNINKVQPSAFTACKNNMQYNLNARPASIVLASTEGKFKFPVLKLCPSTPTPSESESFASHLSPCCTKVSDVPIKVQNSVFYFNNAEELKENMSLMPALNSSSSKHINSFVLSFPNSDSNLDFIEKNTNCNAKKSLLVPFTFNAGDINTVAIPHDHQNHCQHRSLNEISSSGGCTSNNNSPNLRTSISPNTSLMDETITSANTCAAVQSLANRNKLSPTPSRTGALATPISLQSQSDSLSSATTISTATTIIPKEVGEMARRSSDSDLSVTPKGNSFCVASDRLMAATAMMRLGPAIGKSSNSEGMDMLEYPFLTMTKYPPGLILHIGATVAARSVKLLERVPNPDEPEIRDSWWTELRMEIRSHARSLGCNVVLGYSELTTISDDVCVLSATGTAAIINMSYNRSISQNDIFNFTKTTGGSGMSMSLEERNINNSDTSTKDMGCGISNGSAGKKYGLSSLLNVSKNSCTICHVPYNVTSVPFNVKMKKCTICLKGRVPDVLLATLEVPESIQVTGRGCFLQAQVVRAKKDLRSELNAKEISDGLPFLEYELHRVLINKLKAKGMNSIFGLKVQVSIGERMIALVATGTALFITALPVPQVPKIVAGNSWTDKQKLNELQKKLQETFERYQEIYQLKPLDQDMLDKSSDTDDSDEEGVDVDLNCGNKDTCVLEVDDIEDLEIISLLMEPQPPEGFHVVSTQKVPGMMEIEAVKNLQMFTQVWRAKTDTGQTVSGFPKHFQRLLQTIYFKLRTMIPCAICDLKFKLDFPESDQIQILVTGMALGLGEPHRLKHKRKTVTNGQSDSSDSMNHTQSGSEINNKKLSQLQDEDYIFPLDEDHIIETPTPATNAALFGAQLFKSRKSSPIQISSVPGSIRHKHHRIYERNGVDITPLSFIPGGKIEKYLGNLNFFFIRESTSIRENGGISGFVHGFITEVLAVIRAHISALGGNAMVSFYLTELILFDNQHKNQGQCLISIGGDAVYVSYHQDD